MGLLYLSGIYEKRIHDESSNLTSGTLFKELCIHVKWDKDDAALIMEMTGALIPHWQDKCMAELLIPRTVLNDQYLWTIGRDEHCKQ